MRASLIPPDPVLRSRDSDSGGYYNSRLVGNVWSINLDSQRRLADSFNVALLPTRVLDYVK